MEQILSYVGDLLVQTFQAVIVSVEHNWKVLTLSILIAVGMNTYINSQKFSRLLFKRKKLSIVASVLFGAFTPLCACGTTAVLIGMLTTALPWGPIMAFLTSSPLMSPDGFVYISGIINFRFALALTIASLFIGIVSGIITNLIERKTHYLDNQSRYLGKTLSETCSCAEEKDRLAAVPACSCAMKEEAQEPVEQTTFTVADQADQLCCDISGRKSVSLSNIVGKLKLREFAKGIIELGFKQILFFYIIFIAVGYLINHFIPTSIISVLFGTNAFYAVPLASLIGLPLYLTTNSGIPIVQSMLASGASEGAMLSFMITGSATSAWVIAGLATFMKRKAIALYITFVLLGGIAAGYLYDLVLALL